MVRREHGLTLRQAQALISIAHRKHNFGIVKLENLITDLGVSFATLADHLDALKRNGYIQTPNDNKKKPRNLAFNDELTIAAKGEKLAGEIVQSIGASYGNNTVGTIFNKLRTSYEPKGYQLNLFGAKNAPFSKAFEELIAKNPSEPVLTSIAMYTDLDSQLSLMRLNDIKKYVTISRVKLNLEIRNGRLASIAIPTAIRGQTKLTELKQILSGSWSWMGAVSKFSNQRYWQEAMSLGLLQVNGDLLASMKPTTIDTISWLANKTYFTFVNTIPTAPKCSLVLFRESFFLPSEDDLINPKNSDVPLDWLSFIWDGIIDRMDYVEAVKEGLSILKDDTRLLQEYEGKIIPTTIIRKISSVPDLDKSFRTILRHPETITAKILTAISAKPALSIYELYSDLEKQGKGRITMEELYETLTVLVDNRLVVMATSRSALQGYTRLFSFIHLPFLTPKLAENRETNAVLRSLKPYLLQRMRELFSSDEERSSIARTFADLMKTNVIDFESVEREYGKVISRKLLLLASSLEPFVKIREDASGFSLDKNNMGLSNILINSLLYSTITQNEALSMYSQAISDLVEKDRPWAQEVADESKIIVSNLIQQNIKTGF